MPALQCCYWQRARNFHSSFCCRRTEWRQRRRWSLAPRWFSFFFFAHCIFAVQVVGKCFPVHLPATWRGYLSNRLPEKQMTQQQREAVFFYNSSCSLVCGSEESEINDWNPASVARVEHLQRLSLLSRSSATTVASCQHVARQRGSEQWIELLSQDASYVLLKYFCPPDNKREVNHVFTKATQKLLVQARSSFQGAQHSYCDLKTYED